MASDRAPIVLVILDGLGDRPQPALGGQTPVEAAATPHLDALARRGASGVHLPFGPGRAPSSEVSHWALFGYERVPFCGRAVLEALGEGVGVPEDVVHLYGALRPSEVRDGAVWITGRAGRGDAADAEALLASVGQREVPPFVFELVIRADEAIVRVHGPARAELTDSDPFVEDLHPWLRPLPLEGAGDPATADALATYLAWVRRQLLAHPVNARRRAEGLPALDTLTTKWAGIRRPLPSFAERVGIRGAAVTSTRLYRGFAALLGLDWVHRDPLPDLAIDVATRLDAAAELLDGGAAFVHVHTKAPDEAGHRKDPEVKRVVLEEIDAGLAGLHRPPFSGAVVCVTGDHATPSSHSVLHTGDPTPLATAGPAVPPDATTTFGETAAASGALGRLTASDVLPVLLGYANRPRFLGARATAHDTLGLPDAPVPMPLD